MSTFWVRRCAFACALLTAATVISGDPPASTTDKPTKPEPTAEDRIQAALDSRQPFECKELPISELPALLQKKYKIPVVLEAEKIEETGKKEVTLSLTSKEASLRSCLAILLRPRDLDYTIVHEALVITTRESAQTRLRTEVFAVGDFTATPSKRAGELSFDDDIDWDEESLIDLGTTTIDPPTWDRGGGPASARVYRDLLVVSQTDEVIWEIKRLLSALRVAKKYAPSAAPDQVSIDLLDPATRRLFAALDRKVTFSVKDQPLDAAIGRLASAHELPFLLDHRKLEEAGKRPDDVLVAVDFADMSLRSVLRHMLSPHDLGFVVRNEHIVVTTKEVENSTLEVRLYPVRDLIVRDVGDHEQPDYDWLKELIQTTVAPPTWDASGGPGSIRDFEPAGVLVFSQTQEVHHEVAQMLTRLRNARAEQAGAKNQGREGASASKMTVRVYPIGSLLESGGKPDTPADNAKRLEDSSGDVASLVRDLIEPESWKKEPQAYIRALPGRLVVRHRPAVHRQIALLLEKLASPQTSGGGNGGGAAF